MTVDERVDYKLNKALAKQQFELNVAKFQSFDSSDKAAFAAKLASEPRFKRHEKEVETVLADARRGGQSFTREQILAFVLGQKVMQGGATREKAVTAGAKRIQSQQARADSGRGDRAAPSRNSGTGNSIRDLERRLEGVNI